MKKERVRAIIIKEGKILLIKRTFDDKTYWVFTGGGVEDGEDAISGLKRECLEELGVEVEVKDLFTKEESGKEETKGQIEYFYEAKIVGGNLGEASGPEYQEDSNYKGKYEIVWEDLENIKEIDLRPNSIRDKIYHEKF